MPRPQTYTDSEIIAAAQALIAEGSEINPMRVRMRLGGGNVRRIKAVIAKLPRGTAGAAHRLYVPQVLLRDLQQATSESSQQTLTIVSRHWARALAKSAGSSRHENAKLQLQIERMEGEAQAAARMLAQTESQRDEMDRSLKQSHKERADFVQRLETLQSALRNAESDLRAAQRTIDNFERNHREDRDEIRNLHLRIEKLVGEIAAFKVTEPIARSKGRARSADTPRRPR